MSTRVTEQASALVRVVDGQPAVVVLGREALVELAAHLERLNTTHVWRGGQPIAGAVDFVRAARAAVTLHAVSEVPHGEPELVAEGVATESWITTDQAAKLFGITARAVRKRVAVGTLVGRKVAGVLFINAEEIEPHAA